MRKLLLDYFFGFSFLEGMQQWAMSHKKKLGIVLCCMSFLWQPGLRTCSNTALTYCSPRKWILIWWIEMSSSSCGALAAPFPLCLHATECVQWNTGQGSNLSIPLLLSYYRYLSSSIWGRDLPSTSDTNKLSADNKKSSFVILRYYCKI